MTCARTEAQMRKQAKIGIRTMNGENELRGKEENVQARLAGPNTERRMPDAISQHYLHIPFFSRICPYCAFYKERADSSQTKRFCEALLQELDGARGGNSLVAETIFIGGGTPTALTTSQLEFLLGGFRERLDLSALREWTVEANPG